MLSSSAHSLQGDGDWERPQAPGGHLKGTGEAGERVMGTGQVWVREGQKMSGGPPWRDLPNPGKDHKSPVLAGGFFITSVEAPLTPYVDLIV